MLKRLPTLALSRGLLRPTVRNAIQMQVRFRTFEDLEELQKTRAQARQRLKGTTQDAVKDAEENLKASIVSNELIPSRYTSMLITHVGTMDGEDEELNEPKSLSRSEALKFAELDGHDLCFIEVNEKGEAVCRLRYLKMYVRKRVLSETLEIRKKASTELSDAHSRTPSSERQIQFRPQIDKRGVHMKVSQGLQYLKEGLNVRIVCKLFSGEDHSGQFYEGLMQTLSEAAGHQNIKYSISEVYINKKGAGCMITME